MKIADLLLEFEIPSSIKDTPILSVGDGKLTAGDIADYIPGVEPEDVIKYGSKIRDVLQSKITGDYTVSDALIDVATLYPALRLGRLAMTARAGAGAVGKQAAKSLASREVGKQIQKHVEVLPTLKGKGTAAGSSADVAAPAKKKRYNIGDKVPVEVQGRQVMGTVKNILPQGYEVDVSAVKDAPSKTVQIPEPLAENATAGATSAGNIASTGNSPHIAGGTPAVLRRWSGKPGSSGTSGKSIKHKSPKSQNASHNPVVNPNVGNNLIS